jgi:hypothetical protein
VFRYVAFENRDVIDDALSARKQKAVC